MQYVNLGNTEIKISKIALGCMGFGRPSPNFLTWTVADEKVCETMVAKALDLGINYFDTANIYTNGDSELYLGKTLKNLGIKRENVVIETKVFFNEGKLSKDAINREIDGSLKRLNMDYVDIYMIHRFDYDHPIEETLETLDNLVKAGKVRALGASAMFAYQFYTMQIAAEKNNLTPFSVMQNHYNLIYREDERDLIPSCQLFNTTIAPYSPLAGGHLGRITWEGSSQRSKEDIIVAKKYDGFKDYDIKIIQRVGELAQKYDVFLSQIALAWLYHKGVDCPVIGAIKTEHLEDLVKSLDVQLSQEDITYLEEFYVPHKIMGAIQKGGAERIARK